MQIGTNLLDGTTASATGTRGQMDSTSGHPSSNHGLEGSLQSTVLSAPTSLTNDDRGDRDSSGDGDGNKAFFNVRMSAALANDGNLQVIDYFLSAK